MRRPSVCYIHLFSFDHSFIPASPPSPPPPQKKVSMDSALPAAAELPLSSRWTMRAHCREATACTDKVADKHKYARLQTRLCGIATVRDLWQALNHVPLPVSSDRSVFVEGLRSEASAISLFRDGREAMWEQYEPTDGILEMVLRGDACAFPSLVAEVWTYMVLTVVGGADLLHHAIDDAVIAGMRVVQKPPTDGGAPCSAARSLCAKLEIWIAGACDTKRLAAWASGLLRARGMRSAALRYVPHAAKLDRRTTISKGSDRSGVPTSTARERPTTAVGAERQRAAAARRRRVGGRPRSGNRPRCRSPASHRGGADK